MSQVDGKFVLNVDGVGPNIQIIKPLTEAPSGGFWNKGK